jgi:hypothetical protein
VVILCQVKHQNDSETHEREKSHAYWIFYGIKNDHTEVTAGEYDDHCLAKMVTGMYKNHMGCLLNIDRNDKDGAPKSRKA